MNHTKPCIKCGKDMEYNTDHTICYDCIVKAREKENDSTVRR